MFIYLTRRAQTYYSGWTTVHFAQGPSDGHRPLFAIWTVHFLLDRQFSFEKHLIELETVHMHDRTLSHLTLILEFSGPSPSVISGKKRHGGDFGNKIFSGNRAR